MASEAVLTRRILHELNSWPDVRAIKHHGSPYTRKGEPDIYGCVSGRLFLLEIKLPGNKPTLLQYKALRDWKAAGACTGWFDTYEGAIEFVRSIHERL